MKKPYSKPALFAESFELAEHIAACSTVNAPEGFYGTHSEPSLTCQFVAGGFTLFTDAATGCNQPWGRDDIIACYDTPNGTPGVAFGS